MIDNQIFEQYRENEKKIKEAMSLLKREGYIVAKMSLIEDLVLRIRSRKINAVIGVDEIMSALTEEGND